MSNSRRGQVWVETVIYTLIGIALIGLVLAILTPKIKEFRDGTVRFDQHEIAFVHQALEGSSDCRPIRDKFATRLGIINSNPNLEMCDTRTEVDWAAFIKTFTRWP